MPTPNHQEPKKEIATVHSQLTDSKDSQEFNKGFLTDALLHTFYDEKEIYTYANDISSEYKEFKDDVINHLEFLQRRCRKGIDDNNIKILNGVINHITSFLIKNSLVDYRDGEI